MPTEKRVRHTYLFKNTFGHVNKKSEDANIGYGALGRVAEIRRRDPGIGIFPWRHTPPDGCAGADVASSVHCCGVATRTCKPPKDGHFISLGH